MANMELLRWEHTTYSDGRGGEYPAILVSWAEVMKFLGGLHTGDPKQDERLIAGLLEAGAPDWVREAPGWVEEDGWGLYCDQDRPGEGLAGTDETRWAEVPIKPHYAGFGMWQADRNAAEYEWDDAETLIQEIRSNINAEIYELGKDELPPEIEDIRGSVYEEPDRILAYVDEDGHVWYIGVDSRVNHTDEEA
jgi:hypothetical protein